jgi:uncharacterized protein (TIGR02646 family)
MIHVDRKSIPCPAELGDDVKSVGAKERKRTADFFAVTGNETKPYDKFKAYKVATVVQALNTLFHAKCAYCESDIGATQPTDVEHFRPKGGYVVHNKTTNKDEFKRPGYYWLAASWENLMPSCIDCNRERTQVFANGEFGKVGKANKFPLASERTRAKKSGDEKKEKPLLLDPCSDEPSEHLEFTEDGIVRPALDTSNKESRKGKISIEVYGLTRSGLVRRRSNWALMVMASIRRLKNLEVQLDSRPGDVFLEQSILDEIKLIKSCMDPSHEYSGMARQLVNKHYGKVPA